MLKWRKGRVVANDICLVYLTNIKGLGRHFSFIELQASLFSKKTRYRSQIGRLHHLKAEFLDSVGSTNRRGAKEEGAKKHELKNPRRRRHHLYETYRKGSNIYRGKTQIRNLLRKIPACSNFSSCCQSRKLLGSPVQKRGGMQGESSQHLLYVDEERRVCRKERRRWVKERKKVLDLTFCRS